MPSNTGLEVWSMELGIFTTMFKKYSIKETAAKVAEKGMKAVQLNLAFEDRVLSPSELSDEKCREIKEAFSASGVSIAAVGGYTNLVKPDPDLRSQGIADLKRIIAACPRLGCSFVVTETGSANPDHGWTDHPDNYTQKTWDLLVGNLKDICQYAAGYGVTLLIEPHFAHVGRDPGTLRKLLDDADCANLMLVSDPANFIKPEYIGRTNQILEEFFALVGKEVGLAHGKDVVLRNEKSAFVGAGQGVMDYSLYMKLLNVHGYKGPFILEYISESGIDDAKAYVERHLS